MKSSIFPNIYILLIAAIVTGGCSSSGIATKSNSVEHRDEPSVSESTSPQNDQAELIMSMSGWLDTPYRYGGELKSGIDCSAYVQMMMQEAFAVSLPRTTKEQMGHGREVRKSDLRPGDLVFFNTGRNQYHVGIYLSEGEFTHASTTAGVTVSHLQDFYWKDRFLTARRVLDRAVTEEPANLAAADRESDLEKRRRERAEERRAADKPKTRTSSKPDKKIGSTSGKSKGGGTWTSPGKSTTGAKPKKTGW